MPSPIDLNLVAYPTKKQEMIEIIIRTSLPSHSERSCGKLATYSFLVIHFASLRTLYRSALHPCQATQSFHFLYFAYLHDGYGLGRGRADCSAVGNERLPERNPYAYSRYRAPPANQRRG